MPMHMHDCSPKAHKDPSDWSRVCRAPESTQRQRIPKQLFEPFWRRGWWGLRRGRLRLTLVVRGVWSAHARHDLGAPVCAYYGDLRLAKLVFFANNRGCIHLGFYRFCCVLNKRNCHM